MLLRQKQTDITAILSYGKKNQGERNVGENRITKKRNLVYSLDVNGKIVDAKVVAKSRGHIIK